MVVRQNFVRWYKEGLRGCISALNSCNLYYVLRIAGDATRSISRINRWRGVFLGK
jgi:hypothetical protein